MRLKAWIVLGIFSFPNLNFAQSYISPQRAGYVNTGMTQATSIKCVCEPLSKQQSNTPAMQKVPLQQLIYSTLNTGSVYSGLNSAFYESMVLTQWFIGIIYEWTS